MISAKLNRNYSNIISTFLSYLPSRLLVILNALIIVPVFAHVMSTGEMGIFQLAIGLLNLVCTCSTDWISKSVLRFYEKYKSSNQLDHFFSNTILITLLVYLIIIIIFTCFSDLFVEKLLIPKNVLFITMLLVLPVGIRQFLYQMLRVLNRPFLYTFSIVLYQLSLLALFFILTGFLPKVYAVLTAMAIAILCIDFYILHSINLKIKFSLHFDKNILIESSKYALPQIITNGSIWVILNINKYVFQYSKSIEDTATVAVSYLLVSSLLTPLFSSFIFAIFPSIIKKFELHNRIRSFMTNSIQLYCALFLPIAALFCYYSKEITQIAFAERYFEGYIVIAFFAVTLFFHELMKLFNIKYHLKNRTYIEMGITLLVGLICVNLNFYLIPKFGLTAAGVIMLSSMLLLFFLNIFTRIKDLHLVKYGKVAKTFFISVLITLFSYIFVELLFEPLDLMWFSILRMVLYLFACYILSFVFAKKLLER